MIGSKEVKNQQNCHNLAGQRHKYVLSNNCTEWIDFIPVF